MGARNFKAFGKLFQFFLIIDVLILILSFIGTAQFANECYQLMSFGGVAVAFGWFFSLIYCALSVALFVLLGIAFRRKNSSLAVIAFFMQILIRLPSCLLYYVFYLWDGYLRHSWHNFIIFVQIGMGIIGLAYLFLRYIRTRTKLDDNIKN